MWYGFTRLFAAFVALTWTTHAITDNLTDRVTWDHDSLTINGTRLFVFSGEFHYQRMPVPEMWLVSRPVLKKSTII